MQRTPSLPMSSAICLHSGNKPCAVAAQPETQRRGSSSLHAAPPSPAPADSPPSPMGSAGFLSGSTRAALLPACPERGSRLPLSLESPVRPERGSRLPLPRFAGAPRAGKSASSPLLDSPVRPKREVGFLSLRLTRAASSPVPPPLGFLSPSPLAQLERLCRRCPFVLVPDCLSQTSLPNTRHGRVFSMAQG